MAKFKAGDRVIITGEVLCDFPLSRPARVPMGTMATVVEVDSSTGSVLVELDPGLVAQLRCETNNIRLSREEVERVLQPPVHFPTLTRDPEVHRRICNPPSGFGGPSSELLDDTPELMAEANAAWPKDL